MALALKYDTAKLAIFLEQRPALVEYATQIVRDRTRAEDVVQEAFIRFVPDDATTDAPVQQPIAYLYRIVHNLALDWTKRRSMENRHQSGAPIWWTQPEVPRTPEQELMHRRQIERIEVVLADLRPEARLALEMHRFSGYSLQEIADRLGVSIATVHRLVKSALIEIARNT